MALPCTVGISPESFAPGMLSYLDCQAQTLGSAGYQALAASGSPAAALLTGMVTLLIALIGYRMLLGDTPGVREGVLTFVKIGLVLVLATSWPAYQVVIYDLILRAPAELMASIGGASGLSGASGGLPARLDAVDQALKALAIEGVGAPPMGPDGMPQMPSVAPPPFLGFDTFALGVSRVVFLVGAIASFASVRIIAGLLLALGPLFAVFLLFDGTRGLFEGWAKALIGTVLAALATSVVLGVELAFVEPWLATLLARRASGLDIIGVPGQLLAAAIIFAIALVAVTLTVARVALGLRIPAWRAQDMRQQQPVNPGAVGAVWTSPAAAIPLESRSRAAAVADAVAITQRREELAAQAAMTTATGGTRVSPTGATMTHERGISAISMSTGRRTHHRVSARAAIRDRRT